MEGHADERARDAGPSAPVRMCALTRRHSPDVELIRFAAGPDGTIVPDLAAKLPGRGVWLTNSREVVSEAVRRRVFARSLKREVTAGPGLPDLVDELMERHTLQALSLANKAGLVLAGFTKVEAALQSGDVLALLNAADGAVDGKDKLERKHAAICKDAGRAPHVVGSFRIPQLSLALGRSNVVHAALKKGGAAQRFLAEAGRLARYRAQRSDLDDEIAAAERPPRTDPTEE